MSFLVSNMSGSFGLFGVSSRYNGVFFWNKDMFRTIADISCDDDKKVVNHFWKVTRGSASFWSYNYPAVQYVVLSKFPHHNLFFIRNKSFALYKSFLDRKVYIYYKTKLH